MATSSIFRPVERIEDEKTIEKFVNAMEEAERRAADLPKSKVSAKPITGARLKDFFKTV
ncbi:hypothetical protein AGMMS49983_01470 [Clostridia bacterium]|nr:hypothetical protein AGMMS49983_01470 [Clostridia bacterium]